MSDEKGNAISADAKVEKVRFEVTERPDEMSFAEFLQSVPPGEARLVKDLRVFDPSSGGTRQAAYLAIPQLSLHCTTCNGDRVFRCPRGNKVADGEGVSDIFLLYGCSNCEEYQKTFALRTFFTDRDGRSGNCMKFGEIPAYGSPTPKRLLRMFGRDSRIFLKGRQLENHGLGIGAFTYYRFD